MPLPSGTRFGPYEILAPLGAGGMGEVYRARDTKLNRDVALKVLSREFAGHPERLARFRREAQVLASLNHPNVAAIYGLEEDRALSIALVMELVEGESPSGAMPVERVLELARQLAEALDYAHEHGIVHRDLKPANLKVTPEGRLKVLDFGLAKAVTAAEATSESAVTIDAATQAGMIMGTVGYMSPEQARGEGVDKRADIWAFGAVLYELLTGQRAFSGLSRADVMAAVLTRDPDWNALPPGSPVELLKRCLEKDPKSRLRDIADLDWRPPGASVVSQPGRRPRAVAGWVVAAALGAAFAVLAAVHWWPVAPASNPLMRLDVDLGSEANLAGSEMALSPDGLRLLYRGRDAEGKFRFYTRPLEQSTAVPLSGMEQALQPVFSPDSQWVAFVADGKLKKVSVQGGASVTLCDVAAQTRGLSWGDDGDIVVAYSLGGLLRVSSDGGTLKPATELDKQKGEVTHRWPQVLPGSKAILFGVNNHVAIQEDAEIAVHILKSGQRKTLLRGGYRGRYVPSGIAAGPCCGHLVYVHEGTLFAAPMNLERLELTGPAAPIIEDVVAYPGNGGAQFDFSRTGVFVYGDAKAAETHTISWLDSSGKGETLLKEGSNPRLSPDGKRLAFSLREPPNSIWIYELESNRKTRLPAEGGGPVWAPDGRHLAFNNRRGAGNLSWVSADGSGETVQLTTSRSPQSPLSFSPDGKWLAFSDQTVETTWDIWILPLEGAETDHPKAGKPEPFLRTVANEQGAAFSPDGRWIAYFSNESGRNEVYVRSFPPSPAKWPVSAAGGTSPVWSRKGGELFYRALDDRIMAVTYTARGGAFQVNQPHVWSDRQLWSPVGNPGAAQAVFDAGSDARRLIALLRPEGGASKTPSHLTFLLNFFDELRRKAPPGKN